MHSSGLTATQLEKPQRRSESRVVDPHIRGEFHATLLSMSGSDVACASLSGGGDEGGDARTALLQVYGLDPSVL
jgi:hypothetical protein